MPVLNGPPPAEQPLPPLSPELEAMAASHGDGLAVLQNNDLNAPPSHVVLELADPLATCVHRDRGRDTRARRPRAGTAVG